MLHIELSAFDRGVRAMKEQTDRLAQMLDHFEATNRALARFAAQDPFARLGSLDLIDSARHFVRKDISSWRT